MTQNEFRIHDISRPVAVIGPRPPEDGIRFQAWAGFAATRAAVEATMASIGDLPQAPGRAARQALARVVSLGLWHPALNPSEQRFLDLAVTRGKPWREAEAAARKATWLDNQGRPYTTPQGHPNTTLAMLQIRHEDGSHPLEAGYQATEPKEYWPETPPSITLTFVAPQRVLREAHLGTFATWPAASTG